MDGDLVSYEITITPTTTRAYAPYRNPMKFTFDVPAHGGTKVDFSVGPAVSFGKNAKDEKYYLEETSNPDEVKLKSRPNNNAITPSLAAFMHVYPRSAKWAAVGGLFGIGVGFQSTSEVNASLFVGITAVLGKQQKVMVGLGFSFLRVQRIKNDQYVAGHLCGFQKNLNDVTEPVYKTSGFLSISYNLSSRKEIVR
jgi:hypothetical protein